jgi:hypothetical protein
VIEGLVLRRPDVLWNGIVPFLGVVERRIHVENDAAKGVEAMLYHLTDGIPGAARLHVTIW